MCLPMRSFRLVLSLALSDNLYCHFSGTKGHFISTASCRREASCGHSKSGGKKYKCTCCWNGDDGGCSTGYNYNHTHECNYALNNGPDRVQYFVWFYRQYVVITRTSFFLIQYFNFFFYSFKGTISSLPSNGKNSILHVIVNTCFRMSLIISHLSYTGCDVRVK